MANDNFFLKMVKEGKIEFTPEGKIIGFNEHAIFLPVRVMNRLHIVLNEELGAEKAANILNGLGKFQTVQALKRYAKTMKINEIEKDKIWALVKGIFTVLGLGEMEFSIKGETCTVILQKSAFAEEYLMEYGKQAKPVDHYIAGILESWYGAISGKPMSCVEDLCFAKGDNRCQFVLNPILK